MEISIGRRIGMAIRKYHMAYLFILGPVICTTIFFFIPMISSFAFSLTEWSGIQPPEFVGFANYQKLILHDRRFIKSLINTTIFVILGQGSGPAFGLISALALNQKVKFRAGFRTAYFLPVMTSLVVVATVWKMLYNEAGLVNFLLKRVGLPTTRWLMNPRTALLSIIVTSVWQGFGFETVIFLAALQAIPKELYEAAMIDGANAWNRFWHVTLPSLRPVIVMIYIIGIIGSYQVFDQIYVMTGGGPINSSQSIVGYLYNNFTYMKFGYASAVAYVLFAILALFSYLQIRFFGQEE
ncbi:MAG TPA: sugar ABC transporter permease [Chloroflexi bacterium]|nr:sugar ABC transporter permease [Chloroflexota bacterium]